MKWFALAALVAFSTMIVWALKAFAERDLPSNRELKKRWKERGP